MEKILISACLLGHPVRYDGQAKTANHELLDKWQAEERLMTVCPEIIGGLPTPRPPAEIDHMDGHAVLKQAANVIAEDGENVSEPFILGAQAALALCQKHHIKIAILTANSPSCGSEEIYDGTFSGSKKKGDGVTAAMLKEHGIQVFTQAQIALADECLRKL